MSVGEGGVSVHGTGDKIPGQNRRFDGRYPHRVELVRPGPASLAWLRTAVATLQADDRLAAVSVIVPSPYLGLVVRRALAAEGCANVRTLVLRQLAEPGRAHGPAAHDGTIIPERSDALWGSTPRPA